VAGSGCQQGLDVKFTEHGSWSDGLNGFLTVPTGGQKTANCNGSFDAMPMSGSAASGDPDDYASRPTAVAW
jgi:hypothetical protein